MFDKLARQRRGGHCFEQNGLFKLVLEALGFRVTGLGGRVLWNRTDSTVPARSHMVLKLDVEGETFIADVGFGGLTLTAPLPPSESPAFPTSATDSRTSSASAI